MATILKEEKKVLNTENNVNDTKETEKEDPEVVAKRKHDNLIRLVARNASAVGFGGHPEGKVDAHLYEPFKFFSEYSISWGVDYIVKALENYNTLRVNKKVSELKSDENTELGIVERLNAVKEFRKQRNYAYKMGTMKA